MSFSSKDASKTLTTGVSKVIEPGNIIARINNITLETPAYDSNAYNLILHLETKPVGDDFEGLLIDKDLPELGQYKGQIGKVQAQQYSFSDYTNKEGKVYERDQMIFKWLWQLAKEIGIDQQLVENDIQGDTILEYIENAKQYYVSPTKWYHWCIAGSEYENKSGYIAYRLFLPRGTKLQLPYEVYVEGEQPKRLLPFNPAEHIKKKKEAKKVESFEGRDHDDLEL